MVAVPKVRMVVEIDGALYDQFRTLLSSQGIRVKDSIQALMRYYIKRVEEVQKEDAIENPDESAV